MTPSPPTMAEQSVEVAQRIAEWEELAKCAKFSGRAFEKLSNQAPEIIDCLISELRAALVLVQSQAEGFARLSAATRRAALEEVAKWFDARVADPRNGDMFDGGNYIDVADYCRRLAQGEGGE